MTNSAKPQGISHTVMQDRVFKYCPTVPGKAVITRKDYILYWVSDLSYIRCVSHK